MLRNFEDRDQETFHLNRVRLSTGDSASVRSWFLRAWIDPKSRPWMKIIRHDAGKKQNHSRFTRVWLTIWEAFGVLKQTFWAKLVHTLKQQLRCVSWGVREARLTVQWETLILEVFFCLTSWDILPWSERPIYDVRGEEVASDYVRSWFFYAWSWSVLRNNKKISNEPSDEARL